MTNRLAVIRAARNLYVIKPDTNPHRAPVIALCNTLLSQSTGKQPSDGKALKQALAAVHAAMPPGTRQPVQKLLSLTGNKLARLGYYRFSRWYSGTDI